MRHDFAHSLALSEKYADAPFWLEVYKSAFPGFAGMHYVAQNGWAQRGGIDRVVVLESGKHIWVDEKVRHQDWPDIALEVWSSEEDRTPAGR